MTDSSTASGPSEHFGLPGSVSVSILRVYDWETDDGVHGGSPHFHTVSREGYVVTAGSGSVQTLSRNGYAETPLERGSLVWFSPGTVHRLVNDGGLEIVTLMQNAGLPEAGDAVMTFPIDRLSDRNTYRSAHSLPAEPPRREQAARARRDLALNGFAELKSAVERTGPSALVPYYTRAAAIVADRLDEWRGIWRDGAAEETRDTGYRLDALARGDIVHLTRAEVHSRASGPDEVLGMCGRLTVWQGPAGRF